MPVGVAPRTLAGLGHLTPVQMFDAPGYNVRLLVTNSTASKDDSIRSFQEPWERRFGLRILLRDGVMALAADTVIER